MLIPQTITLPTSYRGASYSAAVNFWNDTGFTSPFDFSTWTVSVAWTGASPSISPSVAVSAGTLTFTMLPTDTTAASAATYKFVIKLTAISGSPAEVEYLAHGTLTFTDA